MNPRTRTRNRLYAWGLVPSLLLLVFATKILLMLSAQSAGESAYGSERYGDARAEFAGNQRWNLFESWRAPFNEGDARFRLEDHEGAVEQFETALGDAPEGETCMIRVNLALSHEAIGDSVMDDGDRLAAIDAWRAGREVLAEGGCDTHDVRTTDQRLAAKLDGQESEEQPEQDDPTEKQEADPELEKKRKKVEEKNLAGRGKRKDYQELDDYPYQPDQPDQHW